MDNEIRSTLKKANSHLKKVMEMFEQQRYCVEILQQNMAVIGLLKSANEKLLKRHLQSCFAAAMKSSNEKKKQLMIDEIIRVSSLHNK